MKGSNFHLPIIDYESKLQFVNFREMEEASERQKKTLRKMHYDKINAMSEIEVLKMRIRGADQVVRNYRKQIENMFAEIEHSEEKHQQEIKILKESHRLVEQRATELLKDNRTLKEMMYSLKTENELLKGRAMLTQSFVQKISREDKTATRGVTSARKPRRCNSRNSTLKDVAEH